MEKEQQQIPEKYIRKIIHVDMDAFYASAEQLDNPHLRGKPVAVGGGRERGVVAAASYEAREYGVKSAMPSAKAYQLCRKIHFVKPRFERYRELSHQIRSVFFDYTDLVEPLSLDEAYLDVTENKRQMPSASMIASEIRERIFCETGLRASAGISINKFLAKTASDINKPNGQKTIPPDEALSFLEQLPIEDFFGVGAKTAEKMKRLGIMTGSDLKKRSREVLVRTFGKSGIHYYNIVRGIQKSRVKPVRERKSVGAENTFQKDIIEENDVFPELQRIAQKVSDRLKKQNTAGKTVTLKIKYSDFKTQTRSKTLPDYTRDQALLFREAKELFQQSDHPLPARLLGVTVSNLKPERADYGYQLTLKF